MLDNDNISLSVSIAFGSTIGIRLRARNDQSMHLASVSTDITRRTVEILESVDATIKSTISSQSENHLVWSAFLADIETCV